MYQPILLSRPLGKSVHILEPSKFSSFQKKTPDENYKIHGNTFSLREKGLRQESMHQ